jgi:uncharacterized protein
VPRLGAKAFEQAAGFFRVRGGHIRSTASAVHPERYALVERMAKDLGVGDGEFLVGNDALVDSGSTSSKYVSAEVGMPTLRDIAPS